MAILIMLLLDCNVCYELSHLHFLTMAVNIFHTDARGFGLLLSSTGHGRGHTFRSFVCCRPAEAGIYLSFWGSRCGGAGLYAGRNGVLDTGASRPPLIIIGAVVLTFGNATNSIMQLSTEPEMRGRVMALRVAIALGGTPIGAPIVGWVANRFVPRWALSIGAAAGFAAALVAPRPGPSQRTTDYAVIHPVKCGGIGIFRCRWR